MHSRLFKLLKYASVLSVTSFGLLWMYYGHAKTYHGKLGFAFSSTSNPDKFTGFGLKFKGLFPVLTKYRFWDHECLHLELNDVKWVLGKHHDDIILYDRECGKYFVNSYHRVVPTMLKEYLDVESLMIEEELFRPHRLVSIKYTDSQMQEHEL